MLVLDAGAFVAVERGNRDVVALVKRERLAGRPPVTSGGRGCPGLAWRQRTAGAYGPAPGRYRRRFRR
jgi:hypothetical protein